MDYASLRTEGIQLLGRLAGRQWTDHNAHDPGVTILEQLCFVITDIAYRCEHPVQDLLAASADTGLAGPAASLGCDPVTADDLRGLVIDLARADHATVAPADTAALPFCFHEPSGQVRLWPDPADGAARPLLPQGVLRVSSEVDSTAFESGAELLRRLAERLHASRLLGSDFELGLLQTVPVALQARIEVASRDDPTALAADILEQVEDCLAPPARFAPRPAPGLGLDRYFEGPVLSRGRVERMPAQPSAVHGSDLVHAITNVPQVRAVSSLSLASGSFPLLAGPGQLPRLDENRSEIQLLCAGLPVALDLREAFRRLEARRAERRRGRTDPSAFDAAKGRDRELAQHDSILRQLPAAYGVGPLGLTEEPTPQRRAQALQLQAYLLVFDQLLANQFEQLAQAHRLLSPDVSATDSYFGQRVDDPVMPLDLLMPEPEAVALESAEAGIARRHRFVSHLLARYGEATADDPPPAPRAGAPAAPSLLDRQRFLGAVTRLGASRGTGCDLYRGSPSPLAERLALKYGLEAGSFEIVEHLLLRPVKEDDGQRDLDLTPALPLLDTLAWSDPWSHRVSFVFASPPGAQDERDRLEAHVWRALRAEVPAHLACHLHWLDAQGDVTWPAFQAAWAAFLAALRAYRWPPAGQSEGERRVAQLALRDARDRVIEMLGLGRCHPLRDLPWTEQLIVQPDARAEIVLDFAQADVGYTLCDLDGQPVVVDGAAVVGVRSGSRVVLTTPPVTDNVVYRVLAARAPLDAAPGGARQAWLRGSAKVAVGIDSRLEIEFRADPALALLDPRVDHPDATHARLALHGATVAVQVHDCQEGVTYTLRDAAQPSRVLSEPVVGTQGTIELSLLAVEDVDLRVHASRTVYSGGQPVLREGDLDRVLRLRVRADPAIGAGLTNWVVPFGSGTALALQQTQAGVGYSVWLRPLRDSEFLFEPLPPGPVIELPGEARRVLIARPAVATVWQPPEGFTAVAPPQVSPGGDIELAVGPLDHDALLLVQAVKQHRPQPLSAPAGETIASAVVLDSAFAVLVRPDPARGLSLQVAVADGGAVGPWRLSGGQPGVGYTLQDDAFAGRIAYFHQRDDRDASLNQGLGQLHVEIDFALAGTGDGPYDAAHTPPPEPQIEAGPVAAGSEFKVRAQRAISGIGAMLDLPVLLPPMPAWHVEPASGKAGDPFTLVVMASVPGEHYRLLSEAGASIAAADGTGADLALPLGVLQQSGVYTLVASRKDDAHLALERLAEIAVVLA